MIKFFLSLFIGLTLFNNAFSQMSPIGVWQAIDDNDGQATSHIEIFELDGNLHGKIIKLLEKEEGLLCEKCKGDKKNQPVVGMEILWQMKKDKENEWKGGKILDPENGKEYKCKIKLAEPDVLEVRGFIGFSLLGRTQKWLRYKGN